MIKSISSLVGKSSLFNELVNELNEQDDVMNSETASICMITHEVLYPHNCVTLPCSHCYHEEAFKKFVLKKKKCLYCKDRFNSKRPYRNGTFLY